MKMLTDELFARMMPPNSLDVGYLDKCGLAAGGSGFETLTNKGFVYIAEFF
jgi:hypothetical protein